MSRYTLHAADGTLIGEAEELQKICDVAQHRTVAVDHKALEEGWKYPYSVWRHCSLGHVGTPYETHAEAFKVCAQLWRNE